MDLHIPIFCPSWRVARYGSSRSNVNCSVFPLRWDWAWRCFDVSSLLVQSPLWRIEWELSLSYAQTEQRAKPFGQVVPEDGWLPSPWSTFSHPGGLALASSGARQRPEALNRKSALWVRSLPGLGEGEGCFQLTRACAVACWQHVESFKIDWRDGFHASVYWKNGGIWFQLQGGKVGKSHVRKGLVLLIEV